MTNEAHIDLQTGETILPPDYFVFVKGGTFMMGSEEAEDEKPIHQVSVADFYIARYQLTQGIYEEIMGHTRFCRAELPIDRVSWRDVKKFCKKLSKKTGHQYRIPTEAEWEFAAQGGNMAGKKKTIYAGSNNFDEVAWFNENSHGEIKPVGLLKPNQLGIYDMSGNVWEWCNSLWSYYPYNAIDGEMDYNGPRVLRGGSSYHFGVSLSYRSVYIESSGLTRDSLKFKGFRLALSPI